MFINIDNKKLSDFKIIDEIKEYLFILQFLSLTFFSENYADK